MGVEVATGVAIAAGVVTVAADEIDTGDTGDEIGTGDADDKIDAAVETADAEIAHSITRLSPRMCFAWCTVGVQVFCDSFL